MKYIIIKFFTVDCNNWSGFSPINADSKYVTDGTQSLGTFEKYHQKCKEAQLQMPEVSSLTDLNALKDMAFSKILLGYHAKVVGEKLEVKTLNDSYPTFTYFQGRSHIDDHDVIDPSIEFFII